MKVFISWSGAKSMNVAETISKWLPTVLQSVRPYFTPTDIDKGTNWSLGISKELEESSVGIVCLTPENISEPWVMFEAGALSKKLEMAFVCPFLLGIKNSDLKGPLAQFQATEFNEDDVYKLVKTINNALGESKLNLGTLEVVYKKMWPDLKGALEQIPDIAISDPENRGELSQMEMLQELLRINQTILSRISSKSLRHRINPRILSDLVSGFRKLQRNYRSKLNEINFVEAFLETASTIEYIVDTSELDGDDKDVLKQILVEVKSHITIPF